MALRIHHHSKRHLIMVCTLVENDGVTHIKVKPYSPLRLLRSGTFSLGNIK